MGCAPVKKNAPAALVKTPVPASIVGTTPSPPQTPMAASKSTVHCASTTNHFELSYARLRKVSVHGPLVENWQKQCSYPTISPAAPQCTTLLSAETSKLSSCCTPSMAPPS